MAFFKLVLLALVASTVAQDYTGTNYNAGTSGRSESIAPDGSVQGQYSYTDPTGKLISVKYRAGKEGFMVEGDHLPRVQQQQAQQQFNNFQQQPQFSNYQQQQQYQPRPQQYQQPQQQYQPQPQQYQPQPQQYQPQPQQNNYDDDGQYNPAHHEQYAYNPNHESNSFEQPQQQPQQQQRKPSFFNSFPQQHPNAIPQQQYNNYNQFANQNQNLGPAVDTPEVAQAKREHAAAHQQALARTG